jgi:WW domain-containing oxidoreductase
MMSFYGMFQGTGPSGFGYNSTAGEVVEGLDLTGRTYVITGCNSGLGAETMRVLASRGATVVGAARTQRKAEDACRGVDGDAIPVVCELSEPDSVRGCVDSVREEVDAIDGLICNAGIMALPELQTKHGLELQFLTNHVGHFILVNGLVDTLADDGRVVMLSSTAHERAPDAGIDYDNLDGSNSYDPFTFYGQSKFANLLCAKSLHRQFQGDDRKAYALHPGVIDTNLARHMNAAIGVAMKVVGPLVLKSIPQGSATQTWAAAHPDAAEHSGEYLADCNVAEPRDDAENPELAEQLWEWSESWTDAH